MKVQCNMEYCVYWAMGSCGKGILCIDGGECKSMKIKGLDFIKEEK
jgi:hypothetical protein